MFKFLEYLLSDDTFLTGENYTEWLARKNLETGYNKNLQLKKQKEKEKEKEEKQIPYPHDHCFTNRKLCREDIISRIAVFKDMYLHHAMMGSLAECDITHLNLSNLKFEDTYFIRLNFYQVDLSNSTFKNCYFHDVDLSWAVLNNVSFENCSFINAIGSSLYIRLKEYVKFDFCNFNSFNYKEPDIEKAFSWQFYTLDTKCRINKRP